MSAIATPAFVTSIANAVLVPFTRSESEPEWVTAIYATDSAGRIMHVVTFGAAVLPPAGFARIAAAVKREGFSGLLVSEGPADGSGFEVESIAI